MADDELSGEQLAAGGQVAGAAVEAAQAERTPAKARSAAATAARRRAQEVNINLSEEDARMLATAIVDQIEARGGFDVPPEPVQPPPPPPQPAAPAPAQAQQQPTRPQSFAERFRSRS